MATLIELFKDAVKNAPKAPDLLADSDGILRDSAWWKKHQTKTAIELYQEKLGRRQEQENFEARITEVIELERLKYQNFFDALNAQLRIENLTAVQLKGTIQDLLKMIKD